MLLGGLVNTSMYSDLLHYSHSGNYHGHSLGAGPLEDRDHKDMECFSPCTNADTVHSLHTRGLHEPSLMGKTKDKSQAEPLTYVWMVPFYGLSTLTPHVSHPGLIPSSFTISGPAGILVSIQLTHSYPQLLRLLTLKETSLTPASVHAVLYLSNFNSHVLRHAGMNVLPLQSP